jgi:hypothetical protein
LPERGPPFNYQQAPSLAVLVVSVAAFVAVVPLVTVVFTVMLVVTPVLMMLTWAMPTVVMPIATMENLGNPH